MRQRTTNVLLYLFAFLVLISGSSAAQNPEQAAPTVSYCDLLRNSDLYNFKLVRVRALYETDFELSIINAPECWILKTWVDFDDNWEQRSSWRLRRAINGIRWRVPLDVVFVGKFESNGRYGHMDMYGHRLTVFKVEAVEQLGRFRALPKPKKADLKR